MNQHSLNFYGDPRQRVQNAVKSLKNGHGILVVDDEDRENEGDLIFSAETLTTPQVAQLIRDCSGIVCVCLTQERVKALELPMMTQNNRCKNHTNFTVSIEAAHGVTTGVSAADRLVTIQTAANPNSKPSDIVSPGHVFPLKARPNGVLERRGHTEATVDFMKLAGFLPAGVLCELTNPDGTMARLPQVIDYGRKYDLPVVSVEDLASYIAEENPFGVRMEEFANMIK